MLGLSDRRFAAPESDLISAVAGQLAAGLARFAAYQQADVSSTYARALFDGMNDAMIVVNPVTGIILDANPAACRITGYEREGLIGLSGDALRPPGERARPPAADGSGGRTGRWSRSMCERAWRRGRVGRLL